MRSKHAWYMAGMLLGLLLSVAVWLLPTAASSKGPKDDFPPDPAVVAAIDDLDAYIDGIPDNMLKKGQRKSLQEKLKNSRKKYLDGDVCKAEKDMEGFLKEVKKSQKADDKGADKNKDKDGSRGGDAILEDLYNRGRSLRDSFFDVFLADSSLERPKCFDPSQAQEPQIQTVKSDNTQFSAVVSFGAPHLNTIDAGGETWTQLTLPAVQSEIGPAGMPALPSWQALVAIPHGSTPVLEPPGPPTIRETLNVNLIPFQPQAVDQENQEPPPVETFIDKPFVKNQEAYAQNAFTPPSPCAVTILGSMRDLQIAQIQCTAGQYNPVTGELRLFDSAKFNIKFRGGDGSFMTDKSLSPFEVASSSAIGSVLNKGELGSYIKITEIIGGTCSGEELLILTHPNFRAAADTLATWKNSKGIATTVINVGSGTTYNTATKIDQLIENRFDTCNTRVSYVLLMGDSEWVPPSRTDYNTTSEPDATTGSDWNYATYPHLALLYLDALFPYFAVGRISVDSATEAQTVVDKIVNYESHPPFVNFGSGGPFYTTASIASFFQCCRMNQNGSALNGQPGTDMRSFVQTSETVRNTLMGAGYTVERIYDTNTGYAQGGNCLVTTMPCPTNQIQQPYNASTTPNRYFNGTLLPADLRSGSGFAWNGSSANITSAFNAGRFLMVHRDHGGPSGWGDPGYNTGNVAGLTNGALLPVVYSVNCKSGYFDSETDGGGSSESFMEQLLLKSGGGMVGGIGDVRNSPTWPNSAILRGFIDATWPNLAPAFGSSTPKFRLGDIMDHGKLYLATQIGVAQPAGAIALQDYTDEIILYHVFGDPTLEMWTGNPHGLVLSPIFKLVLQTDHMTVDYAQEGAEITALQRMGDGSVRPLGRGIVKNGKVELPYIEKNTGQIDPKSILLTANYSNAVSVLLQAAAGQPDLVIRQLSLGASSSVFRGENLAERLEIQVANMGGANAPGTVNADGSVKPAGTGYAIDLVLSADETMPPDFATLPAPPGVAFVEDGLLQSGRVSRTQDVAASSVVAMPAGPPVSNDTGGIIPLQAPFGKLFLCGRIDPGDAVAESDEANNVTCIEINVAAPID